MIRKYIYSTENENKFKHETSCYNGQQRTYMFFNEKFRTLRRKQRMVVVHVRMEISCTMLKRYHAALAITLSGEKSSKTLHITSVVYRSAVSKLQSVINSDVKLFYKHFQNLCFTCPEVVLK